MTSPEGLKALWTGPTDTVIKKDFPNGKPVFFTTVKTNTTMNADDHLIGFVLGDPAGGLLDHYYWQNPDAWPASQHDSQKEPDCLEHMGPPSLIIVQSSARTDYLHP